MNIARYTANGDLLLKGEINETEASAPIRYVRDWTNGNNGSVGETNSHWHEVMAIDADGVNVALGKAATFSEGDNILSTWNPTWITDGIINQESNYSQTNSYVTQPLFAQIDLGALYNIKEINVRHYYFDSRTYHGTKTEVSTDGETWITIFDSAISGEYVESAEGRTSSVSSNGTSFSANGDLFTKEFSEVIALDSLSQSKQDGSISIRGEINEGAVLNG